MYYNVYIYAKVPMPRRYVDLQTGKGRVPGRIVAKEGGMAHAQQFAQIIRGDKKLTKLHSKDHGTKWSWSEKSGCPVGTTPVKMYDMHTHWGARDPDSRVLRKVIVWRAGNKCMLEYERTGEVEGCGPQGAPTHTLVRRSETSLHLVTDEGKPIRLRRLNVGPLRKNWRVGDTIKLRVAQSTWNVEVYNATRGGKSIGRGLRVWVPRTPSARKRFIRNWNSKPQIIPLENMVLISEHDYAAFMRRYRMSDRYEDGYIDLRPEYTSIGMHDPLFTCRKYTPLWYLANHESDPSLELHKGRKEYYFRPASSFGSVVERLRSGREYIRLTWYYSEEGDQYYQQSAGGATRQLEGGRKCTGQQERNPVTGRCRKKCTKQQERNPATGRCRKKCTKEQERDLATGRCRKKRSHTSRVLSDDDDVLLNEPLMSELALSGLTLQCDTDSQILSIPSNMHYLNDPCRFIACWRRQKKARHFPNAKGSFAIVTEKLNMHLQKQGDVSIHARNAKMLGDGGYGHIFPAEMRVNGRKRPIVVKVGQDDDDDAAVILEAIIQVTLQCHMRMLLAGGETAVEFMRPIQAARIPRVVNVCSMVPTRGTAQAKSKPKNIICMESVQGTARQLFDWIRKHNAACFKPLFTHMFKSLAKTLHELQTRLRFEHRDMHMSNVMYKSSLPLRDGAVWSPKTVHLHVNFYIIDFGMSIIHMKGEHGNMDDSEHLIDAKGNAQVNTILNPGKTLEQKMQWTFDRRVFNRGGDLATLLLSASAYYKKFMPTWALNILRRMHTHIKIVAAKHPYTTTAVLLKRLGKIDSYITYQDRNIHMDTFAPLAPVALMQTLRLAMH